MSRSTLRGLALVIVLIFLYFYPPFEAYLAAAIPEIRFTNVIFWFASLVGIIAYVVSHWSSFRRYSCWPRWFAGDEASGRRAFSCSHLPYWR